MSEISVLDTNLVITANKHTNEILHFNVILTIRLTPAHTHSRPTHFLLLTVKGITQHKFDVKLTLTHSLSYTTNNIVLL